MRNRRLMIKLFERLSRSRKKSSFMNTSKSVLLGINLIMSIILITLWGLRKRNGL